MSWARRDKLRERLISARLLNRLGTPYPRGRYFLILFSLVLAAMLTSFGLARWVMDKQKVEQTLRSREVMIAIDVSRSMLTEDVKPSRLEVARLLAFDLVEALPGDKIGVLAFAGRAHIAAPLTPHHDAVREVIEFLDEDYIPYGGSDFLEMMEVASKRFEQSELANRALIILSDGERHSKDLDKITKLANKSKIRIHAIGVGTAQGDLIPDKKEADGHFRDRSGRPVLSRLETESLEYLARETGGRYFSLSQSSDLKAVIQASLQGLSYSEDEQTEIYIQKEGFQWFVAPAVILLLIALFVLRPVVFTQKKTRLPLGLIMGVGSFFFMGVGEAMNLKEFNTLEEASKYEEIVKQTSEEIDKPVRWWESVIHGENSHLEARLFRAHAFFKLKKWNLSRRDFSEVLKSKNPKLQQQANWGIGSVLVQQSWRRLNKEGKGVPDLPLDKPTPAILKTPTEELLKEVPSVLLALKSAKTHFMDFKKASAEESLAARPLKRVNDWIAELEKILKQQQEQEDQQQKDQEKQNQDQNSQSQDNKNSKSGKNGDPKKGQNQDQSQGGEKEENPDDFYRDEPQEEQSEEGGEKQEGEKKQEGGENPEDSDKSDSEESNQGDESEKGEESEDGKESDGDSSESQNQQSGQESEGSEQEGEPQSQGGRASSSSEEGEPLDQDAIDYAEQILRNSADLRKMPARIKHRSRIKKPEKDW